MKILNAVVVGIRQGVSKNAKPYTTVHLEFDDPNVIGKAVANCFLPDGMSVLLNDEIQGAFTRSGFQIIEL